MFIIYVIVYTTWCFIGGEEKSPFVLLFDPGGFLIITHLFLLPFCQFPNFEHFESKHNEKREKFDRYICEEFTFGSKRLNFWLVIDYQIFELVTYSKFGSRTNCMQHAGFWQAWGVGCSWQIGSWPAHVRDNL